MSSSLISRLVPLRVVAGLLFGVVVTSVWLVLLLEGNAVPQTPHHVPVAVVGPPRATARLAAELQRGGGFRVIPAPGEASAKRLVDRRKADAIINLDTRQLQTAQAASIVAPIGPILQQIISSPPAGLHVATSDIKPLPVGDPTGLGLFFTCFAFIFGGIPAGVALALTMKSRRPTSLADAGVRVGLIGAYSILQSLVVALLADATLGYAGHQFLTIWAWGALVSAAAMGSTAAAIAVLGVPGALLPVVAIQFFGVPAAPLPGPWNFQPGLFRVLGPFDPMGAGANAIRNSIFFSPASQAQNVVVLLVWTVAPLLVLAGIGWRNQRHAVVADAAPSGVPAVQHSV